MCRKLRNILLVSIAIVVVFFVAGYIGLWIENFHDNSIAGAGMFSVSFIGILGGVFKFWSGLLT